MGLLEVKGLQLSAVLAQLEEDFPAFTPHPNDPINLIMYKSGQRSVIEYIKHKLDEN